MRVGSLVKKKSEVKPGLDYLVICISKDGVDPVFLNGSAILDTYYNPNRTWGLDEEVYIYQLDYRYTGRKRLRSGTLIGMYQMLKVFYKDLPQVCVYWGDDFNGAEAEGPEDCVDPDCIVVCDSKDPFYHGDHLFHIDGAFSIQSKKCTLIYDWWPFPESIIGRENIISYIIKNHLPDEYKETASAAYTKTKTGPAKKSKTYKRTSTPKAGTKVGKRKLSAEDIKKLQDFGKTLGLGKRIKRNKAGDGDEA